MEVPVQEGDVIADKYRVEHVLGTGAMGVVVAAEHLQLRKRVALKFLSAKFSDDAAISTRFEREAQAAVQIKSEHVARVIDVGILETGSQYIVMEHLEGDDLGRVLDRVGRLPIEDAIDYLLQACEALAEAHALGMVHRDLKPENLFLTRRADGSSLVKVLDFGISKAPSLDLSSTSATATTAIMGSPAYMSPEQVRSAKNVDERTDVWALGVILYELLTGRQVYEAENASAVLAMIVADPPPPLRSLRADAPEGLEAVILRCLEKDPAWRIRNVAELARELEPFAPSRCEVSIRRIVGISTPALEAREAETLVREDHGVASARARARTPVRIQRKSRGRGVWIAAGTLLLAAAGFAIVFLLLRLRAVSVDANAGAVPPKPATEESPSTKSQRTDVETARVQNPAPGSETTHAPDASRTPSKRRAGSARVQPAKRVPGGQPIDPLEGR
jgi:serine/threonine-protein kinase